MCRFACPVALSESKETLTPAKKMELIYLIAKGYKNPSPEIVEPIFKCTGCLHCFTYCSHRNMIMHVYYTARNEFGGFASDRIRAVIEKYRWNFANTANPFGNKIKATLNEIYRYEDGRSRDVIFFAGCTEPNFFPDTTSRVFRLAKRIFPNILLYRFENNCCGFPLLNAGLLEEFRANAFKVAENLRNFKLVISNCPACVFVLKSLYKGMGIEINADIFTTVEIINKFQGEKNAVKEDKQIIYHDPCYMTRYRHVFTEPRALLRSMGYTVIEFNWNGIDSECCGAPVKPFFPSLSEDISRRRLTQIAEFIEFPLATSCPTCRWRFQKTLGKEVYDVADEYARRNL